MFSENLCRLAQDILDRARARQLHLACAESCTGGLIAGLLTEISGASDVLERGFVTYSDRAKREMLGVPEHLLHAHGAVSEQVCRAMADGALQHSHADMALAVTGIAGPGGGTAAKPVGLVYIALAAAGRDTVTRELRYGDIGRGAVRLRTLEDALQLLGAGL